jgi:hypothetical protein
MLALRRERVNRAFERVEDVTLAIQNHDERVGVVVSTNFAGSSDGLACLRVRVSMTFRGDAATTVENQPESRLAQRPVALWA